MTGVPFEVISDALRRAGLLIHERGPFPQSVESITDDSRAAGSGSLFLAVRGHERDGHDYLEAAKNAGASVSIVNDVSRSSLPSLVVSDTRRAAAVAAAAFFNEPAKSLRLAGVTGTNGKTTTVGMLRHLLDDAGARAASIGTLGVLIGSEGEAMDGGHGLTTPGPVELQRVLRELYDTGVRAVAMETSSHALHQGRVEGLTFEVAVFTNLTRDHLDYHVTMDAYRDAKAILIPLLAPEGVAVINADDDAWSALPRAGKALRFGLSRGADIRAEQVRYTSRGSEWNLAVGLEQHRVTLPLIGDFNISNALAAAGAAFAMGVSPSGIAKKLSSLPQVPGRLEIIGDTPTVLRDYAHTPDALQRAIAAVRPFVRGQLIVVFGCGGDRDRGKRPEMGRIAELGADRAIVTSDNPRTEDPERILDDIEAGMSQTNHERVEDRRAAIAHALHVATGDDVILLAGKGHETYQIRGTVKYPFDERAIVQEVVGQDAS